MPIVVTLPVAAPAETGFRKELFIKFVLAPQHHLRLENIDLFRKLGFHLVGKLFFPGGHSRPLLLKLNPRILPYLIEVVNIRSAALGRGVLKSCNQSSYEDAFMPIMSL